jgi:hypothetical protein
MADRWQRGVEHLEAALERTPDQKRPEALRLLGLGLFFLHSVRTTIHVKQWWKLKQRLSGEADPHQAHALLDQMAALAEREIANAEATLPLVEADSRLGWEPSMDYVTSPAHLRWKIAQVRRVLDAEIPGYRKALALGDPAASE